MYPKKKFSICILIIIFLIQPHNLYATSNKSLWAIPTAIMGSLALYCGFRWFHTPKSTPIETPDFYTTTLYPTQATTPSKKPSLGIIKNYIQQKKPITTTLDLSGVTVNIKNKHVQKNNPPELIWLVSPGFMGNRPQKYSQEPEPQSGAEQAAAFIQHHIIHGTCLTFDYNDDRRAFNFAQNDDIACLKKAFEKTAGHPVIIVGTCRGATTVLQLLGRLDKKDRTRIKAVILESPAISLQTLADKVAHSYIGWLPKSPQLLHTFFRFWFPNYNPSYPTCLTTLHRIPKNLPILIAHLHGDKVIADSDIEAILNELKKTGLTHIHYVHVNDPTHTITHARLSKVPAFQTAVNTFLHHYGLPHDPKYIDSPLCNA